MTFRPLPGVLLGWDQSDLSPDVFVRYQIYRRPAGGEYRRIGVVPSLEGITYTDYTVPPGIVSEYAVTQVETQGASEVESMLPDTPVQVYVDFQSAYLHDIRNPSRYVQISPTALSEQPTPGLAYKQSFGRDVPVADIGYGQGRTFSLDLTAVWDGTGGSLSDEAWRTLMGLINHQQAARTTFLLRQGRGVSAYVQIDAASRRESLVTYSGNLTFREVYVPEGGA